MVHTGGRQLGLSLTPGGRRVGYTEHNGCHQLDVVLAIRPALLVPGLFYVLFGVRTQRFYPQMTS
jgi:hypothetical protein